MKKAFLHLLGLSVLIVLMSACSQTTASEDTGQQEERVTPVEVAEVTTGDLQRNNEINGTANTSNSSEIIPKSSGELIELEIEKGDLVEKGQTIGRIDPEAIQDNLTMLEISVASAQKQLESAQVQEVMAEQGVEVAEEQLKQAKASGDMDSDVDNADISVENAKIQLEQAEKTLERMETLYEQGAISLSDLEEAQIGEQQARNSYEQAKNTYESTSDQAETGDLSNESSVRQAEIGLEDAKQQLESVKLEVESARLQVEQAKEELSQTEDQLVDTNIKANASGEVTVVNAEVGEMVSNSQSMGTIVTIDPITVHANVNAEELVLFEKGQEMSVYIRALDHTSSATINYISPVTDDSGLYTVEADMDNDEKRIKPGMMVKFNLPTIVEQDALLIPTEAVVEEADQTFVYVIEEEQAMKKEITIQNSQSDMTAIQGDIVEGDIVVTSGQITLSDGNKVTIIEEAAK
ncbi:efflux RND transporter periplasmic adaptor subunit [Aquibacillus sediminis]|uniref:efflux RND transporter periplasmic adaptor subunit n=1 Tax=Aquibacillus sediminis TaxID=2574734 RepID=UPI0011081BEF|nr:efflux RND transporter periplasmic adaptor subunit [Aquibacillus sediminis]